MNQKALEDLGMRVKVFGARWKAPACGSAPQRACFHAPPTVIVFAFLAAWPRR